MDEVSPVQAFIAGMTEVYEDVRRLYTEAGAPYGPSDDDVLRWLQDGERLSAVRKAQKARAQAERAAVENDRPYDRALDRRIQFERIRQEGIALGVMEPIPGQGLELVWLLWDKVQPLIMALPPEERANEMRRWLGMPRR